MQNKRNPAVTAILVTFAFLVIIMLMAWMVAPAKADENTRRQTALDQLHNCQLLLASSTGDQKVRAEQCTADQTRILELLAPSPTSSTSPPGPGSTSTPTPSPTTPTPSSSTQYPNLSNTGVPAGWVPLVTRGSWTISTPGIYSDILVRGTLTIAANNVTLERVKVEGGFINTEGGGRCRSGIVLRQVSIGPAAGSPYLVVNNGAVTPGGYTADRVQIVNSNEGFRVGGKSAGCGTTTIRDSIAVIRQRPGQSDGHADGLQFYDGGRLDLNNVTLDWGVDNGTTAFFAPNKDGNSGPYTVNRLLLKGGGYSFTSDLPGTVTNLKIVNGTWVYGPLAVTCSKLTWGAGNEVITMTTDYQPLAVVRALPCR